MSVESHRARKIRQLQDVLSKRKADIAALRREVYYLRWIATGITLPIWTELEMVDSPLNTTIHIPGTEGHGVSMCNKMIEHHRSMQYMVDFPMCQTCLTEWSKYIDSTIRQLTESVQRTLYSL